MSDYNDQIFALWAAGRLDEGDADRPPARSGTSSTSCDQAMTELVKSVDARAVPLHEQAEDADDTTGSSSAWSSALGLALGLTSPSSSPGGIVRGVR